MQATVLVLAAIVRRGSFAVITVHGPVPIVASDLEQFGEVITHGETGLLCPPGDARVAAAATERLLDDPQLARRLADGALKRAASAYSWRAHTQRILDALRDGRARTGMPEVQDDLLASGR